MATMLGTITVTGSAGGVLNITTDSTGLTLASSFSALTATFVSVSPGIYSGTGYFAAGNTTGTSIGPVTPTGFTDLVVGDAAALNYNDTVSGATILSGLGNDTIIAGGAADTIDAGAGSNALTLTGSSAFVTTAGFDTITASGTALNYNNDGGSGVLVMTSGALSITGSGVSDIYVGTASSVVATDSGTNTYVLNQTSVAGAPSSVLANASSVAVNAASATGNLSFWAGSGNATLVGGSGTNLFASGQGAVTATGGSGANQFLVFSDNVASSTNFTINNFTSSDYLALLDFGSTSPIATNTYTPGAGNTPGNTVITLKDGATITVVGAGQLNTSAGTGPHAVTFFTLPGSSV